jgi:hypothetical protein
MSRKKNCGGTGSPTVISIETSPDLRFPLRAIPASTLTPRARRVAWSASMSSVANAHYVWLPPAALPSLGGTSAIVFAAPGGATSIQRLPSP